MNTPRFTSPQPGETPGEVLRVQGLQVELVTGEPVVEDIDLTVAPGGILGLVGESGSGKTTIALALLGYARPGVRITGGEVVVGGKRLRPGDERGLRGLRGRLVTYVPQDAANALNPALRVGQIINDMLSEHAAHQPSGAEVEVALSRVNLPVTRELLHRYPHQLSGGQQQRVAIAMSLVCEPPLVVLDEPTTGLDVVTQAHVLDEIDRLRRDRSLAMVYVSHDVAAVSQIADSIAVVYAGRVVEQGPTSALLKEPRHPYTRGLLASVPDHLQRSELVSMPGIAPSVGQRPSGCPFAPRCPQRVARCEEDLPPLEQVGPERRVRCFEWRRTTVPNVTERADRRMLPEGTLLAVEDLRAEYGRGGSGVVAVSHASFAVSPGETVGLVGESGSGKSTIARCVAGLLAPTSGRILLDGEPLATTAKHRPKEALQRIQMIFQNPYDSLNPRHRVANAIARVAWVLRGVSRSEAEAEARVLMERVRLPDRLGKRFPSELSGGERQRVAIARALAADPALIICDEVTSALDVSVQAAIVELLLGLRDEFGVALLFISHDLGLVASIADRVLVLNQGTVCEEGTAERVLTTPTHPYTRQLIEAAPRLPHAMQNRTGPTDTLPTFEV